MTPFLSLSVAMGLLTLAWTTHPLWLRSAAPTRFDATAPVPLPGRMPATIAALAALVLAVVGVGYAWVGAPQHLAVAPRPDGHRSALTNTPADPALMQAGSRVAAMIASLAERLAAHPDDADGWHTLARSYAAIGRHAAAVDAFRKAVRLRPDDPSLLADCAVSAALLDPHPAAGAAAQLVARALLLDPANPKALALAGTLALQRKDYAAAIDHWERLARIEVPGSPIARQLDVSLQQARRMAGIQGTSPAAANEVIKRR
ncbi:MAG TPA: tetratricopeptide repeat protein [Burkholderiaceae bacterium]|nr:tetratricopeptide repeat protein [Burkholderiaceae bacterium]